MNHPDEDLHSVINNEHYLLILMEYLPRELYSIVRLTSKSFHRVITSIKRGDITSIIELVRYLIKNGMISLFEYLKESGCNIYPRNLCDIAARYGQLEFLEHLRRQGYPCNKDAMAEAAGGGQFQTMKHLHETGCEWPDDICWSSASGGNVECLNYGHQYGCKQSDIADCVNLSIIGITPLFHASQEGMLEMVRELLNRGADIDSTHFDGLNALAAACQGGYTDVVRELLDRGGSIDVISLMEASRNGHVKVVRELLDRGADLHSFDLYRRDSLMEASRFGHVEAVRELLDRIYAIEPTDDDDRSGRLLRSLMVASQFGHLDVVREILGRGIDASFADENGNTALSVASRGGHVDVVRLLERRSLGN